MLALGAAHAQDAAPAAAAPAAETGEEEVVVTGSRIKSANVYTTTPITQVSATDVTTQGVTKIDDLVNQLPQVFASQNASVSNGASGTATVSLRGLGSDRTLVLIDGKRMGYGSPLDTAADLNQIPGALVERVDVLTGGASATYGSDALAGVVNFVMKKDFEGVRVDAQYNFYQHNNSFDGPGATKLRDVIAARGVTNPAQFKLPPDDVATGFGREATIVMGVNSDDGKGNVTAYFTYRNNDSVLQADYDYSACSLGTGTAPSFTCGGSSTAFPGRFTDFATFNFTLDQTTGQFKNFVGSRDQYNFGPLNYYQRPDERYAFGVSGHYDINEHIEAYGQMMFSDYSSNAQIAPSGVFLLPINLTFENALLSASQKTALGLLAPGDSVTTYIGRRNVEGGGRQDTLAYESYRTVGGIRGNLVEGWDYDLSAQFSRVRLSRIYKNDFSNTRIGRALDVVADPVTGAPVCASALNGTDPNCVPYNIFAPNGVTQAALDYVQIPLTQVGITEQRVVTGEVTGDLGATAGIQTPWATSGLEVAFGFEYRADAIDTTTDAAFASGDGAGQGGPTNSLKGDTDVYDYFVEAKMPIVEGLPGVELLQIDAAYRYSDYSTGISTDTYKVGLEYAPTEDVRLRGTFQKAVRAANVIELFAVQGFNLFDMDGDPCGENPTATLAQCVATGVPTAQYGSAALDSPAGQYNFLGGGNTDLTPEEGDTYTLGFVFTPTFVEGLILSVDYWNIKIDNYITTTGADTIIQACYGAGQLDQCARINRNALGQLWIGDGFVEDLNTNIGGVETSGVDVNASFTYDITDYGSLAFSMFGTYIEELNYDFGLTDVADQDCVGIYGGGTCGTPTPKWRHRARVTWTAPWDFDVALTWRYYGSVDYVDDSNTTRLDYTFDPEHYIDIAGNVYLPNDVKLRLGVNNVFDNDPPISASVGTTGNGNTFPQTYDSLGRYVFVGATVDF
jgi:outer membrane receptor protein involved in Fe transport